jgi:hypothetical protein
MSRISSTPARKGHSVKYPEAFKLVFSAILLPLVISTSTLAASSGCIEMGKAKSDGFDKAMWAKYEEGACKLKEMMGGKLKASSCFRDAKEQKRICMGMCGQPVCPGKCAKPGASFHQGGGQATGAQSSGSYSRVACDFDGLKAKKAQAKQAFQAALGNVGTRCYGQKTVRHIDNHPTEYTDKNGICP